MGTGVANVFLFEWLRWLPKRGVTKNGSISRRLGWEACFNGLVAEDKKGRAFVSCLHVRLPCGSVHDHGARVHNPS